MNWFRRIYYILMLGVDKKYFFINIIPRKYASKMKKMRGMVQTDKSDILSYLDLVDENKKLLHIHKYEWLPEHWILNGKPTLMPEKHVKTLVFSWLIHAKLVYNDYESVVDWMINNLGKYDFHKDVTSIIKVLLKIHLDIDIIISDDKLSVKNSKYFYDAIINVINKQSTSMNVSIDTNNIFLNLNYSAISNRLMKFCIDYLCNDIKEVFAVFARFNADDDYYKAYYTEYLSTTKTKKPLTLAKWKDAVMSEKKSIKVDYESSVSTDEIKLFVMQIKSNNPPKSMIVDSEYISGCIQFTTTKLSYEERLAIHNKHTKGTISKKLMAELNIPEIKIEPVYMANDILYNQLSMVILDAWIFTNFIRAISGCYIPTFRFVSYSLIPSTLDIEAGEYGLNITGKPLSDLTPNDFKLSY